MPRISISTARNWGVGAVFIPATLGFTAVAAGIGVGALCAYIFICHRQAKAIERAVKAAALQNRPDRR